MKYNELKMPTVKTSEIEDTVCKYLKYAHDKYVNDYDAMDTDIERNSNVIRVLTLLASISGLFVGISILFHFAGNAAFPNTHAFDINGAIFIAAAILFASSLTAVICLKKRIAKARAKFNLLVDTIAQEYKRVVGDIDYWFNEYCVADSVCHPYKEDSDEIKSSRIRDIFRYFRMVEKLKDLSPKYEYEIRTHRRMSESEIITLINGHAYSSFDIEYPHNEDGFSKMTSGDFTYIDEEWNRIKTVIDSILA